MTQGTLNGPRSDDSCNTLPCSTKVRKALVEMLRLVGEDMRLGVDRARLRASTYHLADTVRTLWRNVEEGRVRVESIAVLRVLSEVSCQDLCHELDEPCLRHERIIRNLRLMMNLVDYVILPRDEHESMTGLANVTRRNRLATRS